MMAKLLFVFVIGLIALQGATPAAINNLNSRHAFGDVIQELTEELHTSIVNLNGVHGAENTHMPRNSLSVFSVIDDIPEKLTHLLTDILERINNVGVNFNEKIDEIINELSFNRVMEELRQIVADLVADESSPDECGENANYEVYSLDYLIDRHISTCKVENVNEIESIVSKMLVLANRVRILLREVLRIVYVCKRDSNLDGDKYEKCLEEKVDIIQSEIDAVEKATQETLEQVENISNVLVDKFEECARSYETEVENKAQQIVTDLKTCMQV